MVKIKSKIKLAPTTEEEWNTLEQQKAKDRIASRKKEDNVRAVNEDFDWSWKDVVEAGADLGSFFEPAEKAVATLKTGLHTVDSGSDVHDGNWGELSIETAIDNAGPLDIPISVVYYPTKWFNKLYEKIYKKSAQPLAMPKLYPGVEYTDNTTVTKPQPVKLIKRKK